MSKKNDKIKSDIDKMIASGMKKTNAIKEYANFNIFDLGERQLWNIYNKKK